MGKTKNLLQKREREAEVYYQVVEPSREYYPTSFERITRNFRRAVWLFIIVVFLAGLDSVVRFYVIQSDRIMMSLGIGGSKSFIRRIEEQRIFYGQ